MGKLFSTCLLVQEGSVGPELIQSEVNLSPGSGFSPDQEKTVLLAGGFSSLSPETGFPLSPTLFLNHALTSQSDGQLLNIARAELERSNGVNYRSYTVDMDNRLCVIGDDPLAIKDFLDTYGGILDISPLLVKGCDPEIPTVTELSLESRGEHCRLSYKIRSAIDFGKCSYCGECGRCCPEKCIDENLFVDFNKCTLCRECEKVCPQDAVDIHGAVHEDLDFPAVMILGGVKLEDHDNADNVYHEKELAAYFASLYPCQVDEVITHNRSICQYSGRLGHGCDLCVSSCVHGALTKSKRGIEVNTMLCQECGACVSSCPTGAMQNERFSDESFVQYIESLDFPAGGTIVLGDEKTLHQLWWSHQGNRYDNLFFLEFESVGGLSLFHFLYLVSKGVGRVVVLQTASPVAGGMKFLKRVSFANRLLSELYGQEDCIVVSAVNDLDSHAAGSQGAYIPGGVENGKFINRRASLAGALSALAVHSGKEITLKPEGYEPFATVSCNEDRCTECMACLNDCRIGALQADASALKLNHVGAMCVGCGLCVRVCPEDALSISPEFTLDEPFFSGVKLAQAEPMACKKCGKVFGTKKSFERVMAILQQKESVDTSHFEYCEDCRVINLFTEK